MNEGRNQKLREVKRQVGASQTVKVRPGGGREERKQTRQEGKGGFPKEKERNKGRKGRDRGSQVGDGQKKVEVFGRRR